MGRSRLPLPRLIILCLLLFTGVSPSAEDDDSISNAGCERMQNSVTLGNGFVTPHKVCPRVDNNWSDDLSFTKNQSIWINSLIPNPWMKRRIRKDIKDLSATEWSNIADAVYNLRVDLVDGRSKYELMMDVHVGESHDAALFYPWHREYLLRLENALRQYKKSITIPYWDVSADASLPTPADSIVWSEHFFGNGDGIVKSGHFSCWETPSWNCSEFGLGENLLWRNVGQSNLSYIYTDADMKYVWAKHTYNEFAVGGVCYSLLHGSLHNFIGGIMAPKSRKQVMESMGCDSSSVNPLWDPMFMFFHTYLDYVYAQFRTHAQVTDVETDWIDNKYYSNCQTLEDEALTLSPMVMKDLLSSIHEDLYGYHIRQYSCYSDDDCGSSYSWCSHLYRRCLSKVRDGGNCASLPHAACYSGTCNDDNTCITSSPTLRIMVDDGDQDEDDFELSDELDNEDDINDEDTDDDDLTRTSKQNFVQQIVSKILS